MNRKDYLPLMQWLKKKLDDHYDRQASIRLSRYGVVRILFLDGPLRHIILIVEPAGSPKGFQVEVTVFVGPSGPERNWYTIWPEAIILPPASQATVENFFYRSNDPPEGWDVKTVDDFMTKLYHTIVDCLDGCAKAFHTGQAGTAEVCRFCPNQLHCLGGRSHG